jgi:hypothetical protein
MAVKIQEKKTSAVGSTKAVHRSQIKNSERLMKGVTLPVKIMALTKNNTDAALKMTEQAVTNIQMKRNLASSD